jgi:electron transport complex protein RnfA
VSLFTVLIGAALINNFVFTQFLGLCPFFGVSRRTEAAMGMGLSVTFVLTIASAATWVFYFKVLEPLGLDYLKIMVFVLVIAAIVQFLEMYMKKAFKGLYAMLGIYLPMITTNCIITGVALLNVGSGYGFLASVVYALGAGLGFLLAIVLMSVVREKYENHPSVPRIFQGFPLALFAAGLMSIAFMGFQNLSIGR